MVSQQDKSMKDDGAPSLDNSVEKKEKNSKSPASPKEKKNEPGSSNSIVYLLAAACCLLASLVYAYNVLTGDGLVEYVESYDLSHPVAHSLLHDDHFAFLKPIISSMENDIILDYLEGTLSQEKLTEHMKLLQEEASNKPQGAVGSSGHPTHGGSYKPSTSAEVADVDRIELPSEWGMSWISEGFGCPKSYSVIVPMRNAKIFLKYSLDAMYKGRQFIQSKMPDILGEIVIVDDGSTDGSVEEVAAVLKSFGATYKIYEDLAEEASLGSTPESGWQIWRLNPPGEYGYGPSTSRNTGVKQSKGDVIFFVDADDETDAEHFYNCVRAFSIYQYAGVCKGKVEVHDGDIRDEQGKTKKVEIHPSWEKSLENVLIGNTAVRRQAHELGGGFPEYDHFDLFSSNKIYAEDELYLKRINCYMRISVLAPALRYMRYGDGPGRKANTAYRQKEMMAHNYDDRGKYLSHSRNVDDRHTSRSTKQFPTTTTKEVVELARNEVKKDSFTFARNILFYTSFFLHRSGIKRIKDSLQMEGLQRCLPLVESDAVMFSPGVAPKQDVVKDATEIYGKLTGTFLPFDQSDTFLSITVIVAATTSSVNSKKSFQSIQDAILAFKQANSSLSSIPYEIVVVVPKENEDNHEGYWEAIIGSLQDSKDTTSAPIQQLLMPWRVELLPWPTEKVGMGAVINSGFDLSIGDCLFFFDLEGKEWSKNHVIDSMNKLVEGASSSQSAQGDASAPSDFINSLAFRRSSFRAIKGFPNGQKSEAAQKFKASLAESSAHVEL